MNLYKSYIDTGSSIAIKGFLILLIILGHNMIFTYYVEPVRGMDYLYCFHIQSFFLLPFLYGANRLTIKRAINYTVRLYWPYLLLTSVLYLGYYLCYLQESIGWGILKVWLIGTPVVIKQYCGIQIFWFMPAMFALSMLKDLYYYSGNIVRILLLSFSVFFNIILFFSFFGNEFYSLFFSFSGFIPFGIYTGGCYLCWGVLCRWLISKIDNSENKANSWILGIFLILSVLFFINSLFLRQDIILVVLRIVMPIIFILLLWTYRSFFNSRFFREMGSYSFSIYLIHPFVGYILYYVLITSGFQVSLLWAFIALCVMVGTAYGLSLLLYKIEKMRIFLLPRSLSELKSLLRI